jgi:hypothetical protein
VLGKVLPEVKFEVALPATWNKRLVMIGNVATQARSWTIRNARCSATTQYEQGSH